MSHLYIIVIAIIIILIICAVHDKQMVKKDKQIDDLLKTNDQLNCKNINAEYKHRKIEDRFMDEILALKTEIEFLGGNNRNNAHYSSIYFPTHEKFVPIKVKSEFVIPQHEYKYIIRNGDINDKLYKGLADEIVKSLKQNKSISHDITENYDYMIRRSIEAIIYIKQQNEQ